MKSSDDVKVYTEFNQYYIDGKAAVRAKNSDFHIFRFNELGDDVVKEQGPFKTQYFQFALGTNLSSVVSIYNKEFIAEKFYMVIFIPGQIIKWQRTGNWDGYVINVKEKFLSDISVESYRLKVNVFEPFQPLVFALTKEQYDIISYFYELLIIEHHELTQDNIPLVKQLMQVLLIYIDRITKTITTDKSESTAFSDLRNIQLAKEFKQLVFQHYVKEKSVSFYADKLGLTSDLLNKQVKQVLNKSPKEFINEVLLLHAKTILRNPNASVKEVGYTLNFEDYSHFTKFFKKLTGLSPAEFQRNPF